MQQQPTLSLSKDPYPGVRAGRFVGQAQGGVNVVIAIGNDTQSIKT
jgi:hypothetical protein